MTATPKGWLDGFELDASSPIGWTFTSGFAPSRRVFTLERGRAESIAERATAGQSVLEIQIDGHGREVIERLTVLGGVGPASRPELGTLTVEDLRGAWADRHVYGRFNVRRRTGERRRPAPNLPLAVQPVTDDVAFAPWSIDGNTRWTITRMLGRIFGQLLRDGEHFEVRELTARALPLEGLVLDDAGDGAVRRLLGYFGGLVDLFVDSDGTVVVYDRTDESEMRRLLGLPPGFRRGATRTRGAQATSAAPPSVVGPPLWALRNRALERAQAVDVLLSRLIELRWDGQDEPSDLSDQGEAGDLPLHLVMILRVPDLELEIPEAPGRPARTVLIGSWITFTEALAAWNALGWPGGRTLTMAELRRRAVEPQALFALFAPPLLDEEGVYARRLTALLSSLRQSYRLRREWRDRLGELFAARAEMRDPENGTWAPAEVFANYATLLTRRGQEKAMSAHPKNCALFVNRFAAPDAASILSTAIGDMRPSPALVTIEDQDQGVLRLQWLLEPAIGERQIFYSALKGESIPSADPTGEIIFASFAHLSDDHEVSIVLTTIAVAPNDARALHRVRVTPEEVEQFLGLELGPCLGPVAQLRVQPANRRAVARFAWDDGRAAEIRQAFSFRDADAGSPTSAFGDPLNEDEIYALAIAAAARYYSTRLDAVSGSLATGWWPGVRPCGSLGSVLYTVDTDGRPLTTLQFRPLEVSEDFWALLPDHVRQVISGEVIP